jgi:hypothetical protein
MSKLNHYQSQQVGNIPIGGTQELRAPYGTYVAAVEGFETQDKKKGGAVKPAPVEDEVEEHPVEHPTNDKEMAKKEKEEFESASGALFKPGKLPSEHTDGPRLDIGKTITKAFQSFDPNAIQAMTQDTKKLLETQKSLMFMLGEMRPVLSEGRQLLDTFSGLFSGNTGNVISKFADMQ